MKSMDFFGRRKKAPLWPPTRHPYGQLSSHDYLPLQDSPGLKNQTYSSVTSTPLPYTPDPDQSSGYTPELRTGSTTTYEPAYTPRNGRQSHLDRQQPRKGGLIGRGWRGGARIAFFSALIVLIINIVLMCVMMLVFPKMEGMATIYKGTCASTESKNTWLHLAVNILSTIVLAGSNYCMQLLSAPKRSEVDAAHARGHWLDIGVPSMRNLTSVSWKRAVLWWMLALSSIPLHLVYNSVFYAAIATNDYNILYATDAFARGGYYNKTQFPDTVSMNISDIQSRASTFEVLDNYHCIEYYAVDFMTERKNVIAIVGNASTSPSRTSSTLLNVAVNELPKGSMLGGEYDSFSWICDDPATSSKVDGCCENKFGFIPCENMAHKLEDISHEWWRTGGYDIQSCLSEISTPDCHLHFTPHLMAPVIFFNLVKTAVMFWVAFRMTERPLVTIGDAIESFIEHPDHSTEGMCLANHQHIQKHWARGYAPAPLRYTLHHERWSSVITLRHWVTLYTMFFIAAVGLLIGLYLGVRDLKGLQTISNAWSLGIGVVRTQNIITAWNLPQFGTNAVLISAIIANTPQTLVSCLYMIYNASFTGMFLGYDWDKYGAYNAVTKRSTHRPLRVSEPKPGQKSTHILQLPYRYAVPLLVTSGILHWLLSQTLFLANVAVIPRDGTLPRRDEITTCAYSPQGMIWVLVTITIMVSWVLGNSLRRFSGQMTIVGSNSAAIAAACHVNVPGGRAEREDMILKPVAWGDVRSKRISMMSTLGRDDRGGLNISDLNDHRPDTPDFQRDKDDANVGHCSFSDEFVWKPVEGKMYA